MKCLLTSYSTVPAPFCLFFVLYVRVVFNSNNNNNCNSDRVIEITSWDVEAALREMTSGTATGNDHNTSRL